MKVAQTYFDAQGRPVGRISLDGKTRELSFVPRDPKHKRQTWSDPAQMRADLAKLYGSGGGTDL